ncbi:MAG: AMMECR1 domain-containing protein [Methanosphaera sp. rholeuAM270]|nr:MAG: AMMECR1 domain-containing protein [Methanosphaera sp. rholeuAM270]
MKSENLTQEEGQLLIKIARDNIEAYLKGGQLTLPKNLPEIFHEKLGVFVTLSLNSNLRGCIGYPEPYFPLIDALLDVSISAAFDDPRFNPLSLKEFDKIKIEVSVLTKPTLMEVNEYDDYHDLIEIGRDGLIIEDDYHRGLLLPQVPTEQKWDTLTFLENLCYKAGLPKNSWKDDNTKIYSFQAQIFEE